MKATTLFALTIALVLGLGAAATAKYFGFLDKRVEAAPVVVEKPPPVLITVARTNLFKGHTLTSADVKVREARPDEVAVIQQSRKDYLPAVATAVNLRILNENVEADSPLKYKQFEAPDVENLERRISPFMRTVQLDLPKDRCAGGVLQRDDRVDVWMKTNVSIAPDGGPAALSSTCIARDCRIVMKRNSLHTSLAKNADEIPFTLEVNPYRAALISYANEKGLLTLVPRGRGKSDAAALPMVGARPKFSDEESPEYEMEDERVEKIEQSRYSVSDSDLVRVFHLGPITQKKAPVPPTTVVTIRGVSISGDVQFGEDNRPLPTDNTGSAPEKGVGGQGARRGVAPLEPEMTRYYVFTKPAEEPGAGTKPAGKANKTIANMAPRPTTSISAGPRSKN